MKLNKKETSQFILTVAKDYIHPCTKLSLENIVFPKWSDLGLIGMIFAQKVKSKEQPKGCDYDEAVFQVVLRIIDGKVFMTGGKPDSYAWKQTKVAKLIENPENLQFIGTNSAQAVINLANILNTISDDRDKRIVADMFCNFNKDFLLVTSEAEDRFCIEITRELYEAGITSCVDSWMEPDENGEADATLLHIGDFLIVEGECVYCIRRDEFLETHII